MSTVSLLPPSRLSVFALALAGSAGLCIMREALSYSQGLSDGQETVSRHRPGQLHPRPAARADSCPEGSEVGAGKRSLQENPTGLRRRNHDLELWLRERRLKLPTSCVSLLDSRGFASVLIGRRDSGIVAGIFSSRTRRLALNLTEQRPSLPLGPDRHFCRG